MKNSPQLLAVATAITVGVTIQTAAVSVQSQGPLRVSTELVHVDVSVSDKNGNPVTNLRATDFEVREDDAIQTIRSFAAIDRPIPGGSSVSRSQPLASAATVDGGATTEGRTFVIVLDDWHISSASSTRVRTAVEAFLDRTVGDRDQAAVVFTSGRTKDSQDFTNQRAALKAAATRFEGRKLRSPLVERLNDWRVNRSGGRVQAEADVFERERAHRAQSAMAMLRELGERLAESTGRRKALLFVSEGPDFEEPTSGAPSRETSTRWTVNRDLRGVISALNRSNVVVYTLDPRGNATGSEALIESSTIFETQGLGLASARHELQRSQDLLASLSVNTGGAFFLWRPDLSASFDRIVRESSAYYVLGYAPPSAPASARYRRIRVRVTSGHGDAYIVRARDGYVAGER